MRIVPITVESPCRLDAKSTRLPFPSLRLTNTAASPRTPIRCRLNLERSRRPAPSPSQLRMPQQRQRTHLPDTKRRPTESRGVQATPWFGRTPRLRSCTRAGTSFTARPNRALMPGSNALEPPFNAPEPGWQAQRGRFPAGGRDRDRRAPRGRR
jgi:hypothetical protein